MRRLIEATFVSLDGVIESQEKWALPYFSGEIEERGARGAGIGRYVPAGSRNL